MLHVSHATYSAASSSILPLSCTAHNIYSLYNHSLYYYYIMVYAYNSSVSLYYLFAGIKGMRYIVTAWMSILNSQVCLLHRCWNRQVLVWQSNCVNKVWTVQLSHSGLGRCHALISYKSLPQLVDSTCLPTELFPATAWDVNKLILYMHNDHNLSWHACPSKTSTSTCTASPKEHI